MSVIIDVIRHNEDFECLKIEKYDFFFFSYLIELKLQFAD